MFELLFEWITESTESSSKVNYNTISTVLVKNMKLMGLWRHITLLTVGLSDIFYIDCTNLILSYNYMIKNNQLWD